MPCIDLLRYATLKDQTGTDNIRAGLVTVASD